MKYLIDTDTLIYWMKATPQIIDKIAEVTARKLSASAISKAELFYGAYRSQHVEKNVKAVKRLANTIKFLPLDDTAQELFGKIKADLQREGNPIEDSDILIAATALSNHCVLVTNNTKHFGRIADLKLQNWLQE